MGPEVIVEAMRGAEPTRSLVLTSMVNLELNEAVHVGASGRVEKTPAMLRPFQPFKAEFQPRTHRRNNPESGCRTNWFTSPKSPHHRSHDGGGAKDRAASVSLLPHCWRG